MRHVVSEGYTVQKIKRLGEKKRARHERGIFLELQGFSDCEILEEITVI